MKPSALATLFPRVRLHEWPTPFVPMDGLRAALGGPECCPKLWVKHEDLVALGGGGNKIRKLEFVLALAKSLGADTVINTGGIQSNQTRQTAAAAARLGMECHLLLRRGKIPLSPEYEYTGNILACRLFGAHIHFVEADDDRAKAMETLSENLRAEGRTPHVIPVGASTKEGVIGSMLCGEEILAQAAEKNITPDWVVVTVGSAGTCAGIFTGLHACRDGKKPLRVLAVDVLGAATDQGPAKGRLIAHSQEAAAMLGFSFPPQAFCSNDTLERLPQSWETQLELTLDFAGPGYAQPYDGMVRALKLAARSEGLMLDPIYTGKTMAALIAGVRKGLFTPDQNVVFLHSGGQPALYAYAHQLTDGGNQYTVPYDESVKGA